MIGEKLSPVLAEIEAALWEFEAEVGIKPEFSDEGFKAGVKIFMSVMMDKLYTLQSKENMPMEDRGNMAMKLGMDIRKLIKTYTDIDTHEMYENK